MVSVFKTRTVSIVLTLIHTQMKRKRDPADESTKSRKRSDLRRRALCVYCYDPVEVNQGAACTHNHVRCATHADQKCPVCQETKQVMPWWQTDIEKMCECTPSTFCAIHAPHPTAYHVEIKGLPIQTDADTLDGFDGAVFTDKLLACESAIKYVIGFLEDHRQDFETKSSTSSTTTESKTTASSNVYEDVPWKPIIDDIKRDRKYPFVTRLRREEAAIKQLERLLEMAAKISGKSLKDVSVRFRVTKVVLAAPSSGCVTE